MNIVNSVDNLVKHASRNYRLRVLSNIDTAVIHHSASRPTTSVEAIARYHVNYHQWPGIGYHFVITQAGTVYRTNTLETVSYHCGEHNDHTLGICLIGNFTADPPPAAQIMAATDLLAHLRSELSPLAIRPHRAFSQTACPGATWEKWLHLLDTAVPDPCNDTVTKLVRELNQVTARAIKAEQALAEIEAILRQFLRP
jgi:N-acetyl-anhydromuramyl-L-alanine amidase AmpD